MEKIGHAGQGVRKKRERSISLLGADLAPKVLKRVS